MAMELFTKKGGRYYDPLISITKSGQIGLNSACMKKYFKGCNYVLLYGDAKSKTIGIKPVKDNEENTFKISYSQSRTTGSISGHSFLGYNDIDYKSGKNRRCSPEWDEKQKMLIIKTK